jgi:protein-S-isoprenylcysteine O-methyltransferase Ste14
MTLAQTPPMQKADVIRLGLDIAERIFVVGLFVRLALIVFGSVGGGSSPVNLLLLLSEGIVVVLVMLRRPATVGIAAGLMLTGILFQVICKLTLRRSFGLAPANRGLIVAGPYKVVRHPIYASYLVNQAGFLLLNPTAWNAGVLAASLIIQVFRIAAEERLLAHDEAHAAFRKTTPYRLVPGVY